MAPSNNTSTRNTKRKAESPEEESPRPQRKRRRSSTNKREKSSQPEDEVTENKSTSSQLKKHLIGLYDEVHDAKDNEYSSLLRVFALISCRGRLIATDFLKLPPKKRYPDYYVTIKKPIALDTILDRIENDKYDDIEALKADMTLMTSNAKKYNVKGSSIYEDAVALQVISLCHSLLIVENRQRLSE